MSEKEVSQKDVAFVMLGIVVGAMTLGAILAKSFLERQWIHPSAHVQALEASREAERKDTWDRIDLLNSLNRRVEEGWTYNEATDSFERWQQFKAGQQGGYSAITRLYTYTQAYDMAAEEGWLG